MEQDSLQRDVYMETTYLLLRLGFQARQMGYRYLRESIMLVYQDPEALSVTKLVYPEVARKFHIMDTQVEGAIRNAIGTAWTKGDREALEKTFGDLYHRSIRPTNTEVIEILAERVRERIEEKNNNGSIQVEKIW
ncbi:MAG: sporulation initiation factor Spo0A C-terminal domain-containing protein [Roseburia sp.]|nr:sporulation initiation factor Spo0A C-terminal domain-containing protein [Roseburia sp.]